MSAETIKMSWRSTATPTLALIGMSLLVGLTFGIALPLLVTVLAACLAWHLWNLHRFERWLTRNGQTEPPKGWGTWASILDILNRRQREHRHRRQQLAAIIHEVRNATKALPDAVVVLDNSDRVRWSNPSARELLGLRRRKDRGRRITELISDPEVRQLLDDRRDDPDGLVMASPGNTDIRLRLRAFRYGDGGYHILLARDITEIQRIETMRKDFVANVSHELRTPLTVISGYLEIMGQASDPEWSPVALKIEQQSTRMKAIVEDLLTLSRLDVTSKLEEEQPVAIQPLLETLIAEASILSDGEHQFRTQIAGDIVVRGNQKDLGSAFVNLIANAVRYTPEGGVIDVRLSMNDDWAEIAVQDNGPGIAAQHVPRLTERFYRVASDRSRVSGGTGLGLAIVKHVLALHDARLDIVSEPGRGSEFICRFPPERIIRSGSDVC